MTYSDQIENITTTTIFKPISTDIVYRIYIMFIQECPLMFYVNIRSKLNCNTTKNKGLYFFQRQLKLQ